jgi:hypothetical protein
VGETPFQYYAAPGRFTTLGDCDVRSTDIHEIVDIVQGLLVYDAVARPFYGVDLSPQQAATIHERYADRLLATAQSVDGRPLHEAREPAQRVGARCHIYSKLTVSLLRAAGVPARARCGFGTYFRPGWYEDHWVAEYWSEGDDRWLMVDAQMDATWRRMLGFSGDRFAITPSEFPTAGHAWHAWRRGELDAGRCGLSAIDEHGAHWIAGNLRLDFAALNKVEMLPWDVWGAGWAPGAQPTGAQLELFDAVAALTVDPDRNFTALRTRYDTDEALRMDGTVFNVLRAEVETV